jgi:hypothetical protein
MNQTTNKKIYDIVNELNNSFIESRDGSQSIESKMDDARMCQVFSFWREIQDILESGANEIRNLRQQLADLKNDGSRKDNST